MLVFDTGPFWNELIMARIVYDSSIQLWMVWFNSRAFDYDNDK